MRTLTHWIVWAAVMGIMASATLTADANNVALEPPSTPVGYVTLLLINEVPFPGEYRYCSEHDSQAAMLSVLWVLHSRIAYIPPGYTQQGIAGVESKNIIDVMTAGGMKGQVDGFYKDDRGRFLAVSRVHKRVDYLLKMANQGPPGRLARLMNYAQRIATRYFQSGPDGADLFAGLHLIGSTPVTGRGYGWMTDQFRYSPGGNFVHIPNSLKGTLGGNRFYTLRKNPK